MAIIKLGPDNFELFTLATHPVRSYTSSSLGVTGSVHVFARRSSYEKDAQSISAFDETKFEANSLEDLRQACISSAKQPTRARADITFAGRPEDGDIISITDTLGKTVLFEFDAHSPTSMVSQSIAQRVSINNVTGSKVTAANNFISAVNKVSNFEVQARRQDSGGNTIVRLLQRKGGAAGNSTISTQYQKNASGSVSNLTVPSTFIGGSDAGEFRSAIEQYISGVHANPASPRNQKAMEVFRFEPSFRYTKDTGRKNVIKNILMPHHRINNPTSHYAFTNYHALNFFTASYVPSNKALIYPNYFSSDTTYGPYTPTKGFTFDFYINPRRTTLKRSDPYHAGCITHLSSTFSISLVSGSRKDELGKPSAFRILLQLSHSADCSPSNVTISNSSNRGSKGGSSVYPNDLMFLSNDNSLLKNHWHHVAIRWGGNQFNAGTGSFVIDGVEKGTFIVPSSTIAPLNKTGKTQASASFTFGGGGGTTTLGSTLDGSLIILTGTSGKTKIFEFDNFSTPGLVHGVSGSSTVRVPIPPSSTDTSNFAVRFLNKVISSKIGISGTVSSNVVTLRHVAGGTVGNTLIITGSGHDLSTQASYTDGALTNITASAFIRGGAATEMLFGGGENSTTASVADPQALFIGNYFQGPNLMHSSSNQVQFFNPNANTNEGVRSLAANNNDPDNFSLAHPLNAEIHDFKIYNEYRKIENILTSSQKGPDDLRNLIFYLPVFFTKESPKRNNLLTPFQTTRSSTDDPFNVSLSFGVGGHLLNAENYLREFVQKEFPRMYQLTASVVEGDAQVELTMNEYLYATGSIRARNLLILPSDNGLFKPNFNLLKSGTYTINPKDTHEMGKFVNDLGNLDLSLVTLDNLILTSSLLKSITAESGRMVDRVIGSTDNLGQAPGVVLTIFQRTRDNSSNQVVFFDMSNLFYGKKIKPGSIKLHDPGLTGSVNPKETFSDTTTGLVPMTIRDNGNGNLYRADALTPHATWSSVGNVFYDEGIFIIKTPNIPLFGKDKHIIDFKGEHDVHVMKVMVHSPAGRINSSSNVSYRNVSGSTQANSLDSRFVYITGINFHDENFNIIAKTSFAQPVVKNETDEFLFKSKIDF